MDGIDGIMQYAQRCVDRLPQYEKYVEKQIFPPSKLSFSNFFLYMKLQLPTSTQIDAVDFLHGAQFACDLTVNSMYSAEFVNVASGAINESRAAETLRHGLSPECFEAFTFAMAESIKLGNAFELKQLDIHGVYLYGVKWERFPRSQLLQEQREMVQRLAAKQNKLMQEPQEPQEDDDADDMVERMRLDVLFDTKEHLHVRLSDGQEQELAKDTQAIWRFESMVTRPDDIEWRITGVL